MSVSLIVEDGSGLPNANSYCSLEFADTYQASIGNANWAGDDDSKTLALIQATESLDLLYGPKYKSIKIEFNNSALLWPRYAFYDKNWVLYVQNSIPVCLQKATATLAEYILNGSVDQYPLINNDHNIKSTSVKIGDIATATVYNRPIEQPEFDGYRKIDLLLYPIISGKVGSINLKR